MNISYCPKCGRAIVRCLEQRFCEFCGAELPPAEETECVCPMCHGSGTITRKGYQQPQMWKDKGGALK